ncbi:IS1595 family transposase [Niabella hibiscisoli]|uniref:IS1595 family transposase n=1 Tax=Niabella hibiscisoli TaxID=1825928 RepID=UPI001F11604D|nr:IS1595 family transposase [Niabella hibiscisoli]MCH5720882.1 IS1595 family transposase [Niabella hibiscisoli]
MFKGLSILEFNKQFKNNDDCFSYLVKQKWPEGFKCSRCGFEQHVKGRTWHHRRCKNCKYDENVLANTVFHGTKMPLLKAFHMLYRLTAKKKGMSTIELGYEVGVQQKTAWLFKRKVQQMMKEDQKDKIGGNAEADEFLQGGYKSGKGGRSLENKEAVLIVCEKLGDDRTGKIGLRHIDNFEAATLQCHLLEMTKPDVCLTTDSFKSYEPLQSEMNIEMVKSEKGSAMKELHKQIMLFKNWLRGIHHKCSKEHLHAYLKEYTYRFNNRNKRNYIFHELIGRMMNNIPHPYQYLISKCGCNA